MKKMLVTTSILLIQICFISSQINPLNGRPVLPVQQPILINGGDLPPLNVFHNPIWMSSNKSEEADQTESIKNLSKINQQLDAELNKYKSMLRKGANLPAVNTNFLTSNNGMNVNNGQFNFPKFTQTQSQSEVNSTEEPTNLQQKINNFQNQNTNFPKIASLPNNFLDTKMNFTDKGENAPLCIRREGMLKIRDADQKDRDVVVTYAVLTRERLSYFVNAKDESSIQGSIELDKIKESLKLINGFPSCFTVKTLDNISDCSICAESEDSAREWINAITQNAVNCNTISALNNLNKRGLLK